MFSSIILGLLITLGAGMSEEKIAGEPFHQWTMAKAVGILNSSPWARHETFTRVVRGQGSGVSGEKEIYNTFYVRFLSALPIREAYARVQQIQHGYDQMPAEEKKLLDDAQTTNLQMDVSRWIVVSVSFRSNDPNEESGVRRFFQSETVQTLKNKAFLSTSQFPQVELAAYFPPREESVGAKFVFPREADGKPILTQESDRIVFELLDVPGANPRLRSTFSVQPMVVEGKLIL
ncbi:MAG: hypothetical protein FJW35_04380 [Acidobacteria bacterium]|nr:hypothetical protein [Acidobacteriota bacterium]